MKSRCDTSVYTGKWNSAIIKVKLFLFKCDFRIWNELQKLWTKTNLTIFHYKFKIHFFELTFLATCTFKENKGWQGKKRKGKTLTKAKFSWAAHASLHWERMRKLYVAVKLIES